MNEQNLHNLIDRYEDNFDFLNNQEDHDEIFKWKTIKHFRDVWFSDEAKSIPFSEMFNRARKYAAYILDGSRLVPTSGIVKMAELYPLEIESLFRDILFGEDGGDIEIRQNNMDNFLNGVETIRQRAFPRCWKYKHDRHAASCYLAFYAPEQNFIYRYREAEDFAQYMEFGKDIGSGSDFHLGKYYEMCDIIVKALREHSTLLEKHFALIESNKYYRDDSLHTLAFDLMYCCRCYNFYEGLDHASKKESIKAYQLQQAGEEERQERIKKMTTIENQIHALEVKLQEYEQVSLLEVEVTHKTYGVGTVIKQDGNRITVAFATCEKSFIIHKKHPIRPKFENDTELIGFFSDMGDVIDELESLKMQLSKYSLQHT